MYVFDATSGKLIDVPVPPSAPVSELQRWLRDNYGVFPQHLILLDRAGNLLREGESLMTYSAATNWESPLFMFNYRALRNASSVFVELNLPDLMSLEPLQYSDDLRATLEEHAHMAERFQYSAKQCMQSVQDISVTMRLMSQGFEAARLNLDVYVRKLSDGFESFQKSLAELPQLKNAHVVPLIDNMLKKLKLRTNDAEVNESLHTYLFKQGLALTTSSEEYQQLVSAMDEQRNKFHQAIQQIVARAHNVEDSPFAFDVIKIQSQAKELCDRQLDFVAMILKQCSKARDPRVDANILQQIIDNHMQLSPTMVQQNNGLLALVEQIAHMKKSLAVSIVQRLQDIMAVQRLIKECKKNHGVSSYFEQCDRAAKLHAHVERGLRLPHAYIWTLHEMARRIPFRKHYMAVVESAYKRIYLLRQTEIRTRLKFHSEHGPYLPEVPAFECLDDYPHSCVVKPRDFDTNLPSVTIDDVKQALAAIQDDLGNAELRRLMESWPSLESAKELDTDKFMESLAMSSGVEDDEHVSALEEQLLQLHGECEVLEREKDELQERMDEQLRKARQEMDALKAQVAQQQQSKQEKEVPGNNEYNELLKERDELLATIKGLRAETDKAKRGEKEAVAALQQTLSEQQARCTKLQVELEEERQRAQISKAASNEERVKVDKLLNDMRATSARLEKEAAAATAAKEEEAKKAAGLQQSLESTRKQLQTELEAAKDAATAAASKAAQLEKDLAAAQGADQQRVQLARELTEAKDAAKTAGAELAKAKEASKKLEADLAAAKDATSKAESSLAAAKKAEAELLDVKNASKKVEEELAAAREARKSADAELAALKQRLAEQEQRLTAELASEKARLGQELEAAAKQIAELKERAVAPVSTGTAASAAASVSAAGGQEPAQDASLWASAHSSLRSATPSAASAAPAAASASADAKQSAQLAFVSFKAGDLALFVPFGKSFLAFNKGAPRYFLSPKCQKDLNLTVENSKNFIGRIENIVSHKAASGGYNPFSLDDGVTFHEVDAVAFKASK
eukprot:m.176382 g.176382  ORF g.176382 m.176382 type:complete len:1028 (+) comp17364_c0_seq1:234-3317(+)